MRFLIELALRPLLRAPGITIDNKVDSDLPKQSISLPSTEMALIGVEQGDQVMVDGVPALVLDGDEPALSPQVAAMVSLAAVTVRRRLLTVLLREAWALTWTLVGMFVVLITLTGDAQMLATLSVVVGLVLHTLTLRLPKLPMSKRRMK